MYGRVKIYNLGFVIYTVASLLLAIDWLTGRDADESEVVAALSACDRETLQWAIDEIGTLIPA